MKLQSVTLTNFRQFRGVQTFDLTSTSLRPVTLLLGANGAGKTTLLNAFTWALYGAMSSDVEQQDRMVTDSVWRGTSTGDTVDLAVEVRFDHEGRDYRLLRNAKVRKESDFQGAISPKIQLWRTNKDGSSEILEPPQEIIRNILPEGVSRFFFFNGERIENLVKKSAYSEVQKDIKVLLEIEHVERALDHLPKVNRKLTNDLKKHDGDKVTKIQDAIDDLTERQTEARGELSLCEGKIATLNQDRESVLELLRQHADAAPIQAELDAVSKELIETQAAGKSAIAERADLIATRGFQAFTDKLSESTKDMANRLYEKGTLPAPLKREFVEQLMESGTCICGTPLAEHTEPWEQVKEWRQRAGLQAVDTAWQRLSGQIELLADARKEVRERFSGLTDRIKRADERVDRLIERESELRGKLQGSPMEAVQDLETRRMELDKLVDDLQQKVGALKGELSTIAGQLEQQTKERSRAEVKSGLAARERTRSDLVQSVQKALEEILTIRVEDMRQRLDTELKRVFRSITHQAHVPNLSKGFELTLTKNVNGVDLPVPKSTGENQILSLSFVAAVSGLARQIRTERRAEGDRSEDSGTYPIVMDAAFGSLDEDYQEAVAHALAKLAPQLVVLVSKSQGLGTVVNELMPYVSHLGVIEAYTTKEGDVTDDIEINGSTYPYILPSESDYSQLKEIS